MGMELPGITQAITLIVYELARERKWSTPRVSLPLFRENAVQLMGTYEGFARAGGGLKLGGKDKTRRACKVACDTPFRLRTFVNLSEASTSSASFSSSLLSCRDSAIFHSVTRQPSRDLVGTIPRYDNKNVVTGPPEGRTGYPSNVGVRGGGQGQPSAAKFKRPVGPETPPSPLKTCPPCPPAQNAPPSCRPFLSSSRRTPKRCSSPGGGGRAVHGLRPNPLGGTYAPVYISAAGVDAAHE